MDRRDSHRIRRRIPCDFDYEGHAYNGIVVDLSADGLFLQTDTAIEPGSDLELRMRSERFADFSVRGRVVRRRFTPAVLSSMIRRGVGLRLTSAPPAYFEAIGLAHQAAPAPAWSAVEDWEADAESEASTGPVAIDIQVETALAAPAAPEARESGEAWSFEARTEPGPPNEKPEASLDDVEAWESLPSEPAPVAPAWAPEALCRADALLIDAGELDDVHAMLESLGADPVRHRTVDTRGFTGWEQPPRLVVASARSAMRLSVGPNVEAQGIVTIAVVDTESQTLFGILRRQGFRYVVRRPVHPEALRLLLLRALFRGRDRREAPRVPFGCEIALRFGLRRRPATLLELSRTGCRVLTREWLEPGDRLGVRIPSQITGNRPLTLAGRVVRSERRRAVQPEQRVGLALRFDRLADAARAALEALIAAHSLGPTPLPRSAAAHAPARGVRALEAASGAAPPAASGSRERRRGRRASHRREVLALDPGLQRVRHALLGVDLSASGLRVESHPELALGDRVQLGIYDAACAGAVLVEAEVVRDDGVQGLLLRFQPLSAAAASDIARIVAHAPQIESSSGGAGRGLVVAEMLSSRFS
jgi:hypothetical protein